ncbi:MAG: hypothetical protein IKW21_01030 [Lachnospiraceae bacterium]|nr:hypothetical protein [Lachnospiraceae bacterium]
MTKKTFLFVCLLGTLAPGTHAYNLTIPMECTISVEEGEKLPLQIKKNEDEVNSNGKPDQRTLIPEVVLQGNTLRFITPCNGCIFRLVQDNNICYEMEIMGNTLTIPTAFTGLYELQIVSGEYIFYTDVTL